MTTAVVEGVRCRRKVRPCRTKRGSSCRGNVPLTSARYRQAMEFDTANSIGSAALAARTTLTHLARGSTGVDESRMARIAQAAIFSEALMSAVHARLGELRTVAK
jgi:uncharacterized protein YgbK (DUF1537 family)